MARTLVVYVALILPLFGCELVSHEPEFIDEGEILRGGDVETLDINRTFRGYDNNKQFEPSEWTAPVANFYPQETYCTM